MLFDHIEFIWRLLQKFKMIDADSSDEENDVEEIGIPLNADAILQSNVEDPGHRKLSLLSLFNSYTILLDNQNYSWGAAMDALDVEGWYSTTPWASLVRVNDIIVC